MTSTRTGCSSRQAGPGEASNQEKIPVDEGLSPHQVVDSPHLELLHGLRSCRCYDALRRLRLLLRAHRWLRPETEPFDLPALLESVRERLQPLSGAKGVELRIDIDPHLPARRMGDRLRLKQVLINLVGNGIKFTPAGSVQLAAGRLARLARSINAVHGRLLRHLEFG